MLRPLSKRMKTLLFVFLTPVVLFLLLWAYDSINRTLHPPQDTVIDLCPPDGKANNSAEKKECRWVVPVKYRVRKDLPSFFQVQVPWADIDPNFPVSAKAWVTFQFWPNNSGYANSIRLKQQSIGNQKPDEYGLLQLREIAFYFQGTDGVEVEAQFFSSSFNAINPNMRIYRPLNADGKMHWIISLPKLESEAAFELYFKQHIHEIDQKLMEFLSQWH